MVVHRGVFKFAVGSRSAESLKRDLRSDACPEHTALGLWTESSGRTARRRRRGDIAQLEVRPHCGRWWTRRENDRGGCTRRGGGRCRGEKALPPMMRRFAQAPSVVLVVLVIVTTIGIVVVVIVVIVVDAAFPIGRRDNASLWIPQSRCPGPRRGKKSRRRTKSDAPSDRR